MADDVRRWSVTYTKHVKQKRKVYQDGFLELQSSSHQVKLYDDCDKLLDSKIVKLDDTLKSGGTLTFGAYLVDIGDPHGDYKPIPAVNLHRREETVAERDGMANNKTLKCNPGMSKASSTSLSPSHKIIREWQVLYTTQLTQKGKKFHDGILRLVICSSQTSQVFLYDATRRLLDSRFLKKDEVIRSGGSLTFDGHLVEIGEPEGDHKPLSDLNFEEVNCNVQHTGRLKLHNKNPAEFKKSRNLESKSSAAASCPDEGKTNSSEWIVLYTTQLTQKAKKFHDGILKVAACGSQGRQVMLYDATRRLLESRFLKKDEIVKSGESLRFDGHLVDIGEIKIEGDLMPKVELNVEGRSNATAQAQDGQQLKAHNSNPVEWDAMYTTQVNQKSKKYHCGIIRLECCGSYRMQAILLAEDGTTLSRKYLKLSEDISSGSLFYMPNYLVDVGEQRKPSSEGECPKKASALENESPKVRSFDVDNMKLSKRLSATRPLSDGKPLKGPSSVQDMNSGANRVVSRTVSTNKPLRDALSILSVLRKPTQEGGVAIEVSVKECHALQLSPLVHPHVQNQVEGLQGSCCKRSEVDCSEDTSTMSDNSGGISKYEQVDTDLPIATITSADSDEADKQHHEHTSPGCSDGLKATVLMRSTCDMESTQDNRKRPSPILEGQALEPSALDSNGIRSMAYEPHCKPAGALDLGEHPQPVSSTVISTLNCNEPAKAERDKSNLKVYNKNMVADSCTHDGNFGFGLTTSSSCIHYDDQKDCAKSSEEHTISRTDFPSFDLGFD